MRIVLSLLFLTSLSASAYAQTPKVSRIDVVEYGIYTAKDVRTQSSPNATAGIVDIISDIRHAETTRTVPAQVGVRFGFRYKVVGAPAGTAVPLNMVTIFPSPGLRDPAKQQILTQSKYDSSAPVGTTTYKGYQLTNDWEVVPGIWTLQIWYQGRKLAEQKFTVVKQ